MSTKKHTKKLSKLIDKSASEDEGSEHELSHYVNDRVKLMKEVLKIIKPKKIKSMAPVCLKNTKIEEINSMLLEELLGISNKRLKYIFNGQNIDEDTSSSTDPEVEKIDLISLDDISDDDFIDLDSDTNKSSSKRKPKTSTEPKKKKIKKEKSHGKKMDEDNLMSVLELLELQARARAIRSQLFLESKKKKDNSEETNVKIEDSDPEDAVIIEELRQDEIVIDSSESENEDSRKSDNEETRNSNNEDSQSSIKENGDKETEKIEGNVSNEPKDIKNNEDNKNNDSNNTTKNKVSETEETDKNQNGNKSPENQETTNEVKHVSNVNCNKPKSPENKVEDENDGLIINVDQSDMDCIICD